MTNAEYHADTTRISKSGLDLIHKSPAHYWLAYLDPNRKPREEKEYFLKGTASHSLVLEPDLFDLHYYLFDDSEKVAELEREGYKKPRSTTKYKDWRHDHEMGNIGRIALPPADYDYYMGIVDAIKKHPAARELMGNGVAEQTVLWEDFETGAACKCRPDWLDTKSSLIVDLKFVEDGSADGFAKAAYNHRYHVQAPFYFDGVLASDLDFTPQGFVFLVVEKPTLLVSVYYTPSEVFKLGRREYDADLEKYQQAKRSGVWEGYPTTLQELKLPRWAWK